MTQAPTIIELPWPPSTNKYWRNVVINGSPRTLLSAEARTYQESVRAVAWSQVMTRRKPLTTDGRLSVTVYAWPPDKRKRDLDNLLKSLLDACTKTKLWNDDSQIDELRIVRRGIVPDGKIIMRIKPIEKMLF